jgi:SAM-dependent methyltransferase
MISKRDVQWCYRVLLDREPESDAAIQSHRKHRDLAAAVRAFIAGAEFRKRWDSEKRADPVRTLPLDVPRLAVQSRAAPAQLEALVALTQNAWANLGASTPHFSVLTNPVFLPENLPGSIDAFWSSGDEPAAELTRIMARHGLHSDSLDCLEYGCGVGRVSMKLARLFRQVIGYDFSAAHLELARQRATELGAGNLRFIDCSTGVLEPLTPCDVFYSIMVLQHNPPPVIRALIGNALSALRPFGLAVFQVPTYILGYQFSLDAYLGDAAQRVMEMHCLPQHEIFALAAEHDCEVLEVREDDYTGFRDIYVSNSFVLRKAGQRG